MQKFLLCALLAVNALPAFATEEAAKPAAPAAAAEKTPVTVAQEANAAAKEDTNPAPKVMWKPGQALETTTDTEDIVATYDVELAKRQVVAYADSPEAAFILAVALTRTSRVEEALKEVQRARKLATSKGGPAYFDKMIASYEKMLVGYPNDNQVRYGLAWAYYMKAYLLGQHSRRVAQWKAAVAAQQAQQQAAAAATASGAQTPATATGAAAVAATPAPTPAINSKEVVKALTSGDTTSSLAALAGAATAVTSGNKDSLPQIPTALTRVDPADIPEIKGLYEKALQKIDEIQQREPNDVWTIVYGAHLRAEYTGNLDASMKTWQSVAAKFPNNPAPFFFLGEGYLKKGNLRESINNVGKAIALRALGN